MAQTILAGAGAAGSLLEVVDVGELRDNVYLGGLTNYGWKVVVVGNGGFVTLETS